VAVAVESLADVKVTLIEVDLAPEQAEEFRLPKAGVRCRGE